MPLIDLPPFEAWDQEPAAVLPGQRVPLLVFLHGSDEFGGNTEPQVQRHGPWMEVIGLRPDGYHPDASLPCAGSGCWGFTGASRVATGMVGK